MSAAFTLAEDGPLASPAGQPHAELHIAFDDRRVTITGPRKILAQADGVRRSAAGVCELRRAADGIWRPLPDSVRVR